MKKLTAFQETIKDIFTIPMGESYYYLLENSPHQFGLFLSNESTPEEHLIKSRIQVEKLIAYLQDGSGGETYSFLFALGEIVRATVIAEGHKSIATFQSEANLDELINFYQKCYPRKLIHLFLSQECYNKEKYAAFFQLGNDYTTVNNQSNMGQIQIIFTSFEKYRARHLITKTFNELFSNQEIQDLIVTHFENSVGYENLSLKNLIVLFSKAFPAGYDYSDFLDSFRLRFNLKTPEASEPARHVGIFNLSLAEIAARHEFKNVEEIETFMSQLSLFISPYYAQSGIYTVSQSIIKNEHYRIFVESLGLTPVNLQLVADMFHEVLASRNSIEKNIYDFSALEKLILYYQINEKIEIKTEATRKIKL